MKPDFGTRWIWLPVGEDDRGRNLTVCFRRPFEISAVANEVFLSVSADSRYVIFLNGKRVGQGPARSWHHSKQYDTYEISQYLNPGGRNIIAAQVVRWGISCGCDEGGGPGGFIAQIWQGQAPEPLLVTDNTWRTTVHVGYARHVPRHSVGLAFTEKFDARTMTEDWTTADFDDSQWCVAHDLGPVGTSPWNAMEARTIPLLSEQPCYPVRAFDVCAVSAPKNTVALDMREFLFGGKANLRTKVGFSGILVSKLIADEAGPVTMVRMNTSFDLDLFGGMRINGHDVEFTGDRATFDVRKGHNLMVVRFDTTKYWHSSPSWVFEADFALAIQSPTANGYSPVAVHTCPSAQESPVIEPCWQATSVANLNEFLPELHPLGPEIAYVDPFALSNMRKVLPEVPVSIENLHSLCSGNAEYASVIPPHNGDLEFILDFGKEVVGFLQFELDAPEGSILDFNCFEAIQEGRWSWTDNLNNTLRYTTREGWQRFHSVVRRGFRYVQVSVRNARRPVRIQEIRCLQSTYPVQYEGAFSCSDQLLTATWELGRRTLHLCMEDTFVDCAAYEQTFWVGDSRNEALAAYAAFGDARLTARCLFLAAQSMWHSPLPDMAVPTKYGIIPDWSMFWVLACEEYYRYTGDIEFARNIYDSITKVCNFLLDQRGSDGLMRFAGANNMLDWAPMDSKPGAANTHENALLVEALQRAATLSNAVKANDAARFMAEREQLLKAINMHLWDEHKHAYIDSIQLDGSPSPVLSQQTQTMAFLCDCVPEHRRIQTAKYITDVPDGWVTVSSPWMTWFSFEALARIGDFSSILDIIRLKWGDMIKAGATTCWETFANSSFNGRWKPTRSWCHAWSSAPTYFLTTYQLGVQGVVPGWKHVRIAPQPAGLTWAEGRVPTPHGTITVSWHIVGNTFNITVVHPPGLEIEIVPPDGYRAGEKKHCARATTTVSD